MTRWLVVMAGGGIGSLVRYVVAVAMMRRYGEALPLGTFVINVTGSFLIGFLMTLLTERFPDYPNLRLMLVTGFLGGYTTFSSYEYETFQLTRASGIPLAVTYALGTLIVGFAGVWLGIALAGRR